MQRRLRRRPVDLGLEEVVTPSGRQAQEAPQDDNQIKWDDDLATSSARQAIYTTLDPAISEFRLLALLPSSDETSTLECQLSQASFDTCESFEALSYVWGDPKFTASIKLNGISFHITPHLEEALRHLRYHDEPRLLWVDALCIDQANNYERRYQVGLMRKIYSNCSSGIVWLGSEEEGTLSRAMTVLTKIEGYDIKSLGFQEEPGFDRFSEGDTFPNYKLRFDDWNAIQLLLVRNPVWKRVWIMQEISLAPRVVLTSAKRTLEWSIVESLLGMGRHYTDAFHQIFGHGSVSRLASESFSTAQIIKSQRELCRQQRDVRGTSLLDVLARFRFTESTDPRDKVFALLGLASDALNITADYSLDIDTVFTDTAIRIINKLDNLDIICQSQWQSFSHPNRRPGLPTWVPDFSWPGKGAFLFAQRAIFGAGRLTCKVPIQLTSGRISLNGFVISELTMYNQDSRTQFEDKISYRNFEQVWRVMMDWWKAGQASKSSMYPEEEVFRAFWRTVAADRKRCPLQPMQRLSDEDIAADDALIQAFRKGSVEVNLWDLRCYEMIVEMIENWRFCLTDSEHFSMIPNGSEPGDLLVVLDGAKVPLVLRPVPPEKALDTTTFLVVGGAYVHGLMDGQAITGAFEERCFLIS